MGWTGHGTFLYNGIFKVVELISQLLIFGNGTRSCMINDRPHLGNPYSGLYVRLPFGSLVQLDLIGPCIVGPRNVWGGFLNLDLIWVALGIGILLVRVIFTGMKENGC